MTALSFNHGTDNQILQTKIKSVHSTKAPGDQNQTLPKPCYLWEAGNYGFTPCHPLSLGLRACGAGFFFLKKSQIYHKYGVRCIPCA
jgi:hypothetical protein